jgi:putative hemolysin
MIERKEKHAKLVAELKRNMDRLLTVVLIGTNFLSSLTSAIATAFAISLLGSKGSSIAPFVTAFFITTFAQIVPKTAAALNPEKICCRSAVPLLVLQKLLFPVVWLFSKLSHIVVAVVETVIKPQNVNVTQEELKTLIDVGEKEGTIEKDERRMLNKIIEFNDLSVNDIMKHRSVVSMVSENASYNQLIAEFEKSGFSTLTVYKTSKENVTGVINYKKILFSDADREKNFDKEAPEFASKVKQNVMFVPGSLSVLEILQKFRTERYNFAVVLNEQGDTSGIVTMEDVIKTVFGRMTDENSYDNLSSEEKIKMVSFNTFLVPGELKLDDVNEFLNLNLESDNMNTIGGWVLEKIGHLPSVGDVTQYGKTIFITEDVLNHRIVTVKVIV